MRSLIFFLTACLSGVLATGCFTFRDVDDLFESDADTSASSDSGNSDTDSPTDIDTDTDSGSGSDATDSSTETMRTDSESGSASVSDSETRTEEDSDSQTSSDGTDSESATDTMTDTASDSETTCEDACANTCCGDECCDNAADVCHENECCAPSTCDELNVQCGEVSDGCGDTLDCGTCEGQTAYCSEAGQCVDDCGDRICGPSPIKGFDCGTCPGETEYCSVAGRCVNDCEGRICGLSPIENFDCGTCPSLYPYCTDDGGCIECVDIEDENCDGFVCDLETNACLTDCGNDDSLCATGLHCDSGVCIADVTDGDTCDEPSDCLSKHCQNQVCCEDGETCCTVAEQCTAPEAPICSPTTFSCRSCGEEDLCASQYPEQTPFCDAATGRCEECVQNDDCRDEELAVNPSPLGLCTPDHTCTCWVESDTWECNSSDDCPPGSKCAQDPQSGFHFVCLSACETANDPTAGLACQPRVADDPNPSLVWVPMTSCFAFNRFTMDCSSDATMCSVDGKGGISDGVCIDGLCSYLCSGQDSYCPEHKTCGDSFPYNGACVP